MKQERDFSKSFHPTRILRADDTCSLKKHFSHALREVIGYLEKLAANDPDNFAWCGNADIVQHCNRYKGPKYKERIITAALAFLAENYIITPVEKTRHVGAYERKIVGWYVMPHDAMAKRTGNRCEWRPIPPEWREKAAKHAHRKVHHRVHHRVHQQTPPSASPSASRSENLCITECISGVHQQTPPSHDKKKS